jgi:hypothetical protein
MEMILSSFANQGNEFKKYTLQNQKKTRLSITDGGGFLRELSVIDKNNKRQNLIATYHPTLNPEIKNQIVMHENSITIISPNTEVTYSLYENNSMNIFVSQIDGASQEQTDKIFDTEWSAKSIEKKDREVIIQQEDFAITISSEDVELDYEEKGNNFLVLRPLSNDFLEYSINYKVEATT